MVNCVVCNKEFLTKSNLRRHILNVHEKIYRCVHCPEEFHTATNLKRHYRYCNGRFVKRQEIPFKKYETSGLNNSQNDRSESTSSNVLVSSFVKLPQKISATKAIINVINNDFHCFKWAILSAIFPVETNKNKTFSYIKHLNKLNFEGISYPTPLSYVRDFSKLNNISINVYSYNEDFQIFCILIADVILETHIDLLYVPIGENIGHYCWIRNISRLISGQLTTHQHKVHICKRCLTGFQSEEKLAKHTSLCYGNNELINIEKVIY